LFVVLSYYVRKNTSIKDGSSAGARLQVFLVERFPFPWRWLKILQLQLSEFLWKKFEKLYNRERGVGMVLTYLSQSITRENTSTGKYVTAIFFTGHSVN
jgi:hypothetical protein